MTVELTADAAAVDIRDAFFDEVYAVAAEDRRLVFLTDDMDALSLRRFRQDFPDRFINVGVAEQNMINVAAGLASCGKRVVAYGIAPFVTMRCFEQIKVNLCSMRLPVTIVGVGAGFSFGFDGPTHHGTQDIGIMRVLPEITIYNPCDSVSAALVARLSGTGPGPSYVRLDKGVLPAFYTPHDSVARGYKVVRPLADVNIVATGFMTHRAVACADRLAERGRVGVVDVLRLKPLGARFVSDVIDRSRTVITLEEHSATGGLGTMVSELVATSSSRPSFMARAVRDEQFLAYSSREWFLRENGLDDESLTRCVLNTLS